MDISNLPAPRIGLICWSVDAIFVDNFPKLLLLSHFSLQILQIGIFTILLSNTVGGSNLSVT